jgi:hypothetical protein
MSQLKDLDLNFHFTKQVEPEAFAAIFDTDEVHLLQSKVSHVRSIVGTALEETGVRIVDDGTGYHRMPGALSAKFRTALPKSIYRLADEPFTSGVSHTDGKAHGYIHIPMEKDSAEFEISVINRPDRSTVSKIHIPNTPELFESRQQHVPGEVVRFTILGIAAAAKFAARWNVAPGTDTD